MSDLPVKLNVGDIFLLNNTTGGFLSSCIRFFTRSKYTHCAVYVGEVCGEPSVLSAEELITIKPVSTYFDNKDYNIEIYTFESTRKLYSINKIYNDYGGSVYGFMQLFWFVWRWILESFGVDTKSMKNWFPDGEICSEMGYDNVWYTLGTDYTNINKLLGEYNSNTVAPSDVAKIIIAINNLFLSQGQKPPVIKTYERKLAK